VHPSATDPPLTGEACRAPLHPLLRFAILFGVLAPARIGLRSTSVPALLQSVLVAGLASGLVYWLWAPCSDRKRGLFLMIGSLWAAVALQAVLG
jgi:hypothetical protein